MKGRRKEERRGEGKRRKEREGGRGRGFASFVL